MIPRHPNSFSLTVGVAGLAVGLIVAAFSGLAQDSGLTDSANGFRRVCVVVDPQINEASGKK